MLKTVKVILCILLVSIFTGRCVLAEENLIPIFFDYQGIQNIQINDTVSEDDNLYLKYLDEYVYQGEIIFEESVTSADLTLNGDVILTVENIELLSAYPFSFSFDEMPTEIYLSIYQRNIDDGDFPKDDGIFQRKIVSMEDTLESLQKDIDQLKENLLILLENNRELKSELNKNKSENESLVNQDIDLYENLMDDIEQKLDSIKEESNLLESQIDNLNEKVDRIELLLGEYAGSNEKASRLETNSIYKYFSVAMLLYWVFKLISRFK